MSDDDERYDSDVRSGDEVSPVRPKKRVSHQLLIGEQYAPDLDAVRVQADSTGKDRGPGR